MSPHQFYTAFRAYFGAFVGVVVPNQNCRFTPTCSQYCQQAIAQHGLIKGCAKCLYRLARCHPLHPGGHDPV